MVTLSPNFVVDSSEIRCGDRRKPSTDCRNVIGEKKLKIYLKEQQMGGGGRFRARTETSNTYYSDGSKHPYLPERNSQDSDLAR